MKPIDVFVLLTSCGLLYYDESNLFVKYYFLSVIRGYSGVENIGGNVEKEKKRDHSCLGLIDLDLGFRSRVMRFQRSGPWAPHLQFQSIGGINSVISVKIVPRFDLVDAHMIPFRNAP